MKRIAFLLTTAMFAVTGLSACGGHVYEKREPGVSISGETAVGVTYKEGSVAPYQDTKLTISLGGSI